MNWKKEIKHLIMFLIFPPWGFRKMCDYIMEENENGKH